MYNNYLPSRCKRCKAGTFPYECSSNYGHCGCRNCPVGKMGTEGGECITCSDTMQYSDTEASSMCKNCTLGSVPFACRSGYGHCGCSKCPKGKIGEVFPFFISLKKNWRNLSGSYSNPDLLFLFGIRKIVLSSSDDGSGENKTIRRFISCCR